MKIPLSRPDITEAEISSVGDVLRTPQLSLGPRLEEFEHAMAAFTGSKYGIAVNSGTSGLHCCIRAAGLGRGDEVITTPFSFVASANVLLYEGVTPVFVDIDATTLNIDPARIEDAITARTKAILIVHVFGRPCPMAEIISIARRHNLILIEDACEAIGAEYDGRQIGSFGEAGVFAFYPNKQITTGEGGVVVTDDPEIDSFVRACRNQGRRPGLDWFDHAELGFNYRMSELNAVLGTRQLERIDEILLKRLTAARGYDKRLRDNTSLVLPSIDSKLGKISWFVYVVRLRPGVTRAARDWVVNQMREAGIGCGRYFAPIHLQPLYRKSFNYAEGDFPVAESEADRAIALPFFNQLSVGEIDEVCSHLQELISRVPNNAN